MNKTQFIEKSLKKLDDVLQKSHVAYGTTYPPNPELKKLFEDELSECWDMARDQAIDIHKDFDSLDKQLDGVIEALTSKQEDKKE